jgi:hypothetical protein
MPDVEINSGRHSQAQKSQLFHSVKCEDVRMLPQSLIAFWRCSLKQHPSKLCFKGFTVEVRPELLEC